MTCKSSFNLISLVPDGNPYQITINSITGWYVLYQPFNTAQPSSPIPIYHQQGSSTYLGWTTATPVNCDGIINYPTGKCQLLFQDVQESVNTWLPNGSSATNKTELLYSGRCVSPTKLPINLSTYLEVYCFYQLAGNGNLLADNITGPTILDNHWHLGHVSYREILQQSSLSNKIFGVPVNLDLRAIGLYSNLIASLNLTNIREEDSVHLPTPTELLNNSVDSVNLTGKILTISLDSKSNTIYLIFSNPVAGLIGSIHATNITQENVVQYKIENLNNFNSITLDLNSLVYPLLTSFEVIIGNQVISTLNLP